MSYFLPIGQAFFLGKLPNLKDLGKTSTKKNPREHKNGFSVIMQRFASGGVAYLRKLLYSIATIFVLCIKHQVTDLACTAQSKYYATFVGILKIDISFFWQVSLFTLILLLQMRICHPFEQISFDANLSFDCRKM